MSEWTIKTLKAHYDQILKEKDKALNAALVSLNDRLGLLNELRGGVATKEEIRALEKMVDDLKSSRDTGAGKSEGYAKFLGWIAFGITLLLFLFFLYDRTSNG